MNFLKTAVVLAILTTASPLVAGEVMIDLTGVQAGSGDLYIGLQTKDQFLKDAGSYGTIIRAPKAGNQAVQIKNVAEGEYHIGIWHDTNGDGKFSADDRGIPIDGWSSYKSETLRAAPTWDAVKFSVPSGATRVKLAMVYPK